MTIALTVDIERDEVLHFLGYPPAARPAGRIDTLLSKVLAEARRLAGARGAFVSLPADRAGEVGLETVDGAGASGLVIGMVSIGDALERRVTEWMRAGATTEAVLLDAAGSAAVEEAADRLGAMISGDDAARARHVSCRISPGYGRWPIASQTSLFALLPHEDVGVSLLPSMLMMPRKSISFAMWLGAGARPLAGLSGCPRCQLDHCRYRRVW